MQQATSNNPPMLQIRRKRHLYSLAHYLAPCPCACYMIHFNEQVALFYCAFCMRNREATDRRRFTGNGGCSHEFCKVSRDGDCGRDGIGAATRALFLVFMASDKYDDWCLLRSTSPRSDRLTIAVVAPLYSGVLGDGVPFRRLLLIATHRVLPAYSSPGYRLLPPTNAG